MTLPFRGPGRMFHVKHSLTHRHMFHVEHRAEPWIYRKERAMLNARWISPGALGPGDVLCGDDGTPFATVQAIPVVDPETESVWVQTDWTDVEFPPGVTANVQYR